MKKVIVIFTILLLLFVNFSNVINVVLADNIIVQALPFFKFYYNNEVNELKIKKDNSKPLIAIPEPLNDFDFDDSILPAFNFSDFPQYQYYCYYYFDQIIADNERRFVKVFFSDEPFEFLKRNSTSYALKFDLGYECDITKNVNYWSGWNVILGGRPSTFISGVSSDISEYYSFNSNFKYNNTVYDNNITNNDSRINITYEYAEDYSKCSVNATIAGGSFSDKLYYSFLPPTITGDLTTKRLWPADGLKDIMENTSIFFRAEDYQGNLLGVNSLVIDKIRNISEDGFKVEIRKPTFQVTESREVIPYLLGDNLIYYDIYAKIHSDNSDNFNVTNDGFSDFNEFFEVDNSEVILFSWKGITLNQPQITIDFEVRNKQGQVCLTKTIVFTLKQLSGNPGFDDTITNGKHDNPINDVVSGDFPEFPLGSLNPVDYIVYFFNIIFWLLRTLVNFVQTAIGYVFNLTSLLTLAFGFLPAPIPQLLCISLVVGLIMMFRK